MVISGFIASEHRLAHTGPRGVCLSLRRSRETFYECLDRVPEGINTPQIVFVAGTTKVLSWNIRRSSLLGGERKKGQAEMERQYPQPPFETQHQPMPGYTEKMNPTPDHGETSYKGSGKLEGSPIWKKMKTRSPPNHSLRKRAERLS